MNFAFMRGGGRVDRAASARGLFRGSVAMFCVLAMLGFASCSGDGDGGSAQAQTGTMKRMNGYFLTQFTEEGETEPSISCQSEDLVLNENMDGTVDSTSVYGIYNINQRGYKAENVNEGRANTEILALAYSAVNPDGTNRRNPGIYYFQKISNDPIRFGGLWIGKPNQPQDGSEGMICPYIMVPDPDDTPAGNCPSDIDMMLGDTCYHTNATGFVDVDSPDERDMDSQ